MEFWNHIYEHFNPVAFDIGFIKVHWYGIMYVMALLSALFFAKWINRHDRMGIPEDVIDDYFIWVEVGVILGARLGYVLFYDPSGYYMDNPLQIFSPFDTNGNFTGISGMSYHGAVIGALLATYLFGRKYPVYLYKILDIAALGIPVGYVFGRIGNFLNQELVGSITTVPWGILVNGVMRHPSQLYEAFLEGFVIAMILYLFRFKKPFDGALIAWYGMLYGLARFIVEFYRMPDVQLGYVCCGMSMGQLMSVGMIIFFGIIYLVIKRATTSLRA